MGAGHRKCRLGRVRFRLRASRRRRRPAGSPARFFAPALLQRAGLVLTPRRQTPYYLVLAGALAWQHERVLGLLALRDGGWTALLPVVVLGQALLCLGLVFRKTPKTTEYYLVAALAAQAAGSLLQYYPVPDSWHILWALARLLAWACIFSGAPHAGRPPWSRWS